MEKFGHSPGNTQAVKSTCSSANLIQNNQAAVRSLIKNMCGFLHFHHKSAPPPRQFISSTYPGKYAIDNSDSSRSCRHRCPHLRHEDYERHLPKNGGLPCHVGPGNYYYLLANTIQMHIIGNEAPLGQGCLNHWVASLHYMNLRSVINSRSAVVSVVSDLCQSCKNVQFRYHSSGCLNTLPLAGNLGAECQKEFSFQPNSALISGKHLGFVLF